MKVIIEHYRFVDGQLIHWHRGRKQNSPLLRGKVETKGGGTLCTIIDDIGDEWYGYSSCSIKDNFNYRIGREIAYGRAKKYMERGINCDIRDLPRN